MNFFERPPRLDFVNNFQYNGVHGRRVQVDSIFAGLGVIV